MPSPKRSRLLALAALVLAGNLPLAAPLAARSAAPALLHGGSRTAPSESPTAALLPDDTRGRQGSTIDPNG